MIREPEHMVALYRRRKQAAIRVAVGGYTLIAIAAGLALAKVLS